MPEVIETIDQAELSEKLKEFMQAHRIHLTAGQQRYLHIKRATDAVLSGLALLVLLIPLGLVVILQKLSSPREPAIFRQQRVGRGGKLFTMYKFRTMKTTAPQYASTKEFADAEQYISKLGHILRSTSIDELPQLYNVLRGDMSLIGPRPLIPQEDEVHYRALIKANAQIAVCRAFDCKEENIDQFVKVYTREKIIYQEISVGSDYDFFAEYAHYTVWGALFQREILKNITFHKTCLWIVVCQGEITPIISFLSV